MYSTNSVNPNTKTILTSFLEIFSLSAKIPRVAKTSPSIKSHELSVCLIWNILKDTPKTPTQMRKIDIILTRA